MERGQEERGKARGKRETVGEGSGVGGEKAVNSGFSLSRL